MSISEQVKELRELADALHREKWYSAHDTVIDVADTIESLSAKLADMERSADDCGGGWILCKDRLPGEKEGVKIGSTDEEFLVTIKNFSGGEYCTVSRFEEPIQDFWHDNVVAWKLKPEPCHEH